MKKQIENQFGYQIAALLFVINGAIICPTFAIIDHDNGTFLPLGMMCICIGLACFVVGQRKSQDTKTGE
jgi:hypothetical protein